MRKRKEAPMAMQMRRLSAWMLLGLVAGCSKGGSESKDAQVFDYTKAPADNKALIYNLVGRWFPMTEIKRLDDDTMTPEEWCAREPAMLEIFLDDLELRCENGKIHKSPIARIERNEGLLEITLRAPEDSKFKRMTFASIVSKEGLSNQPRAMIVGLPCTEGAEAIEYGRFAKVESLKRQILDGRHCAQILTKKTIVTPVAPKP